MRTMEPEGSLESTMLANSSSGLQSSLGAHGVGKLLPGGNRIAADLAAD